MRRVWKKLNNVFNKIKNNKPSGNKKQIIGTGALAGNLIFGNLKSDFREILNYSNATPLAPERVISNQELSTLEDYHNSARIIRTGTGTILVFQQEAYDASSNEEFHLLDQDDKQVILAKAEGSNPVTPPTTRSGPSNFPTPPSGGQPSPPVSSLNPFRTAPRIVDQGLDAGGNPAGAGNGADSYEEQDNCPAPKKQKLDEINSEHPSFYSNQNSKSSEQCELEEELSSQDKEDKKYGEFDYEIDKNGNPILLITDNNPALGDKDRFIKVDHEQTKTHLHHAEDLGVNLPDNFDMNDYRKLDREGRIDYANKNVPRDTIIEFQNEIGKAMTEGKPAHVPGFAGKYKKHTDLKINTEKGLISVVNEQGQHISTYGVTKNKLRRIIKDGFWILKNRNI